MKIAIFDRVIIKYIKYIRDKINYLTPEYSPKKYQHYIHKYIDIVGLVPHNYDHKWVVRKVSKKWVILVRDVTLDQIAGDNFLGNFPEHIKILLTDLVDKGIFTEQ